MPGWVAVTIFDPRQNGFGLLRLLLATMVIVSHAWPLGGFGPDPGRTNNNLGIIAVECFFALSGFLITRSAQRLSTGRFLWHRALRIMPGYWVCLLLIALAFAPLVWRTSHGLQSYPGAEPGPFGFVLNNLLLTNAQQQIGETLTGNPHSTAWDAPIYTLTYEFICYLIVAALAALHILNRRVVAVLAVAVWGWQQLILLGALGGYDARHAMFTVCFLVGSLIYLWRDVVLAPKLSWLLAATSLVIAIGTYTTVGFRQVGIVALAYLCIWTGSRLPSRVGVERDFSYGMYIYGWPVLQLASFFGLNALGLPVYLAIVVTGSVTLAAASWFLIESRALRLKSASAPRWLAPRENEATTTS